MPVINVILPVGLLRDIRIFADYHGIDVNTFILWAIAEKTGELKGRIIDDTLNNQNTLSETLMHRYPSITKVMPEEDFMIYLEFEDEIKGTYDVKPLISSHSIYSRLSDPEIFKTVTVAETGDYIQWDGNITLNVDTIIEQISFIKQ
jgi:hypothetical protein